MKRLTRRELGGFLVASERRNPQSRVSSADSVAGPYVSRLATFGLHRRFSKLSRGRLREKTTSSYDNIVFLRSHVPCINGHLPELIEWD